MSLLLCWMPYGDDINEIDQGAASIEFLHKLFLDDSFRYALEMDCFCIATKILRADGKRKSNKEIYDGRVASRDVFVFEDTAMLKPQVQLIFGVGQRHFNLIKVHGLPKGHLSVPDNFSAYIEINGLELYYLPHAEYMLLYADQRARRSFVVTLLTLSTRHDIKVDISFITRKMRKVAAIGWFYESETNQYVVLDDNHRIELESADIEEIDILGVAKVNKRNSTPFTIHDGTWSGRTTRLPTKHYSRCSTSHSVVRCSTMMRCLLTESR